LEAFVDAALEDIPIPEDKQKKKRHAVKTQTKQQEQADSPSKSVEGKNTIVPVQGTAPFPQLRLITILIWDIME